MSASELRVPILQREKDVKLTRKEIEPGRFILTDGAHLFWACQRSKKIRWALLDHPDDGIGVRGHGARDTLDEAIRDSQECARLRGEATQ